MPLLASSHLRRHLNLPGQPVHNPGLLGIGELHLGILRRHLAVANHVKHLQPPVDILPLEQVGVECIDPKLALLLIRSVTAHAHTLQHRLHLCAELGQARLRHLLPLGQALGQAATKQHNCHCQKKDPHELPHCYHHPPISARGFEINLHANLNYFGCVQPTSPAVYWECECGRN